MHVQETRSFLLLAFINYFLPFPETGLLRQKCISVFLYFVLLFFHFYVILVKDEICLPMIEADPLLILLYHIVW